VIKRVVAIVFLITTNNTVIDLYNRLLGLTPGSLFSCERRCKMKYALVTVTKGIIDEVTFYDDQIMAIHDLSKYVKAMNPEHHDAAVYGQDGMVVNAKAFLDENDQYVEINTEEVAISDNSVEPTYIIGNPVHHMGFMLASPDDPLGYKDPVAALSDLGQMRKDYGNHLKLYRVLPVEGPVAFKAQLEKCNANCEIDDFNYQLVDEYLR